jgi:hypothetical protein
MLVPPHGWRIWPGAKLEHGSLGVPSDRLADIGVATTRISFTGESHDVEGIAALSRT